MSQSKTFNRKVIYIVLIGALLIPLSLVSRPATRDRNDEIKDHGGVLSDLRTEHNLSQAKLSEIDPGSETMKLASLGLRGVAVNLLWMNAIAAKDKKDWDTFSSTLNSLVKIQPNFVRVWEYQGHNLSYNVSVEFDDYEQRYHWIKKGINFMTRGIDYNRRDHRIIDNLGFFCGHKFGESDERYQFRRLFRHDNQFHDEMDSFANIDLINTPYGPDHWLLAYQWYDKSSQMVDLGVDGTPVRKYKRDMVFYQYRPAQLRNMGLSLHREFRSAEYDQDLWNRAHEEWMEYGNRSLRSTTGVETTMEGMIESMQNIEEWRAELDEMAPGARKEIQGRYISEFNPDDQELLKQSIDSLDDEQLERVREMEGRLFQRNSELEFQIAQRADVSVRNEAEEIAANIRFEVFKMRIADKNRDTINYEHWKYQTLVESLKGDISRQDGQLIINEPGGIDARQALFDASELQRKSIFDSYTKTDPLTGEQEELPGAIQKYDEAFQIWAEIMRKYPTLKKGPLMDDLIDVIKSYMAVRRAAGLDAWPEEFPLQFVIDYRATLPATYDELPTSKEVQELLDARRTQRRFKLPQRPDISFTPETESEESGDN